MLRIYHRLLSDILRGVWHSRVSSLIIEGIDALFVGDVHLLLRVVTGDREDNEADKVANQSSVDHALGGLSISWDDKGRESTEVLAETLDDHAGADDSHAEDLDVLIVLVANVSTDSSENAHDDQLGDGGLDRSADHNAEDATAGETEESNAVLDDEGLQEVADGKTSDNSKNTTNNERSGRGRVELEADAHDDTGSRQEGKHEDELVIDLDASEADDETGNNLKGANDVHVFVEGTEVESVAGLLTSGLEDAFASDIIALLNPVTIERLVTALHVEGNVVFASVASLIRQELSLQTVVGLGSLVVVGGSDLGRIEGEFAIVVAGVSMLRILKSKSKIAETLLLTLAGLTCQDSLFLGSFFRLFSEREFSRTEGELEQHIVTIGALVFEVHGITDLDSVFLVKASEGERLASLSREDGAASNLSFFIHGKQLGGVRNEGTLLGRSAVLFAGRRGSELHLVLLEGLIDEEQLGLTSGGRGNHGRSHEHLGEHDFEKYLSQIN